MTPINLDSTAYKEFGRRQPARQAAGTMAQGKVEPQPRFVLGIEDRPVGAGGPRPGPLKMSHRPFEDLRLAEGRLAARDSSAGAGSSPRVSSFWLRLGGIVHPAISRWNPTVCLADSQRQVIVSMACNPAGRIPHPGPSPANGARGEWWTLREEGRFGKGERRGNAELGMQNAIGTVASEPYSSFCILPFILHPSSFILHPAVAFVRRVWPATSSRAGRVFRAAGRRRRSPNSNRRLRGLVRNSYSANLRPVGNRFSPTF